MSVLMTCARDVALNSPERELIVTCERSSRAFTDVNRTGQSLWEQLTLSTIRKYKYCLPIILDHLKKVLVIYDSFKDTSESQPVMPAERGGEADYWHGGFEEVFFIII